MFTASLYQMDIERVRFSLAKYLRTRIFKIENNLDYIISRDELMDRLSIEERTFAAKLQQLNSNYYDECLTSRLNSGLKNSIIELGDLLKHSTPQLNVT